MNYILYVIGFFVPIAVACGAGISRAGSMNDSDGTGTFAST